MKNSNESISKKYDIDNDIVIRLLEIQQILHDKYAINISIKEILSFLNGAMNYDEFQIWLLEKKANGVYLSCNDILKKFFADNSNYDIVKLYDLDKNHDEKNIEYIRTTLDKPIPCSYCIRIDESGDGSEPIITETSRKIAAKSLLK